MRILSVFLLLFVFCCAPENNTTHPVNNGDLCSVNLITSTGKEFMWDSVKRYRMEQFENRAIFYDKNNNKININGGIIITTPINYILPVVDTAYGRP